MWTIAPISARTSEEAVALEAESVQEAVPKVVLVDDDELLRRALREALDREGMAVVGMAPSADDAVGLVSANTPDVVIMDLGTAEPSGIEATRRISTLAPNTRVLVLTRSAERHEVLEAILAGACGYLVKDAPAESLVSSIKAAAAGETVISPKIAGQLLDQIRGWDKAGQAAAAIRAILTPREVEVLKLLAAGKDNPEIADDLFISRRTVKNHISNILSKLHLQNRIQAAVHAVRSGIV
jgi:DNA-binding NarL/FixJ family response regulator